MWIVADTDGQPAATNEKIVFDIVSTTEAYVSLSIQDRTAEDTPWSDREETLSFLPPSETGTIASYLMVPEPFP